MSQSGTLTIKSGGGAVTESLTGNSGGPVGPDAGFNINILGNNSSGINIVGNPATNTLTVTAFQATTTQEGTVTLATNAQAIAGTDTANALTSSNLAAKLGTQTAHSLAVFEGSSSALTALGVASNGQIPIGSTGADPVLATITAGTGVSISNGAGSITISAGGSVALTFDGDTGSATPAANTITISGGTTGLTTTAAGSTVDLTGILDLANGGTNANLTASNGGIFYSTASAGAILAGTTTARQMLQSGASTTPAWSTSTWPATTTINQLLYSSSANTVAGLATANNGTLITSATGVPSIATLTDGQIIIGSSAGSPLAETLTAGTGISITNGHNSITIAATGSEMTWTDEAASFNALAGNGYFITAGSVVATLPSAPSQGNMISFVVDTTNSFEILANTGQVIRIGAAVSASAGNAVNNARGDSVTLVYRSSDTTWIATSVIGTWTVT